MKFITETCRKQTNSQFSHKQKMQQQDGSSSSAVSFCLSFNTYSTDKLVDIATKVSKELNDEKSKALLEEEEINNYEDDDFEFDLDSSRLFFNGEIRQVFPVFNRELLLNNGDCDYDHSRGNEERHVAALKKLFIDDDDQGRQASSDEDEPEEIQRNAIFCIWSPKRNPADQSSPSPSRCKKSNSTGSSSSSKKWFKLRDLIKRSNSDGKESFVFLSKPKSNNSVNVDSKDKKVKSGKAKAAAVSAHEAFYVKNKVIKEGGKKKSYLPYKQNLLGVFANYKPLARTLPPSF